MKVGNIAKYYTPHEYGSLFPQHFHYPLYFMYPGVSVDGGREEDMHCLPLSQPVAVTGDFSDQDGDYPNCSLRRSASCIEPGSTLRRFNSETSGSTGLTRRGKVSKHCRSGSSQNLNINVTTAPHSNVPVFVISDRSSSCSEGLSRFPSLFDEYFQNHRMESDVSQKTESKDHTTNNFSLNSSSYHAHRLTKSPSYSCYSLICSSDTEEIPRVNYHDNSPFSLPDMTLPPSHY